MDLVDSTDDRIVLSTTKDEIRIAAASIREALEALDDWEFPIRVGAELDEAKHLQSDLREILRAIKIPD